MDEFAKRKAAVEELVTRTHQMYTDALTEDDLALFVRAHLHLESVITRKLDEALTAGAFDWEGDSSPDFLIRAKMAFGLNILDQNGYNFAKKAARIRNQFAHRLDRHLTEDDTRELYNQVGGECRAFVELADTNAEAEWRKKPKWWRDIVSMFWYQTVVVFAPHDYIENLLRTLRDDARKLQS